MTHPEVERKTRAIMFSDMRGYSAMMSADESRALGLIEEHNRLVTEVVSENRGRIVKFLGDGVLSCYESASDAVACGVQLQRRLAARNADLPAERHIVLRIGIHIGDVLLRDGDAFGDGVNIAARIEPLAEPGGICISQTVYDMVRSRPEIQTIPLGPKELKNIKEAVHLYKVLVDAVADHAPRSVSAQAPPPPVRAPRPAFWAVGGVAVAGLAALAFAAWWLPGGGASPSTSPPPTGEGASALEAPTDRLGVWLDAQPGPVLVGVVPFGEVGGNQPLADALDMKLHGLASRYPRLRVVPIAADEADLPAAGKAAGVDSILTGTVGTLGDTTMINLERVWVAPHSTSASAYREIEAGGDLGAAMEGLITDVLVAETDGADEDAVSKVIRRYKGQLQFCYESALKDDPSLAGRVEVAWTILPSGRTTDARIVVDTTGSPALGDCMLGKVSRWLFPVGMSGDLQWPFIFQQKTDPPGTSGNSVGSGSDPAATSPTEP